MSTRLVRTVMCLFLVGAVALPLPAQSPRLTDYSRGNLPVPNPLAPYTPPRVPAPDLRNSARLESLLHEGKLTLTLQDAIFLAIENNLDIASARYDPSTAEASVLAARGGPLSGLVSGGADRVGFAALDPVISTNLYLERSRLPLNNPFLTGTGTFAPKFNRNLAVGNFSYTQGFITGTAFSVGFDNTRSLTNPSGNLFNHSINTNLYLGFSQPLLNGFGKTRNARAIRVAKNNQAISNQTFAQRVMDIVTTVERAYWELVFAREDVKVKEQSVALGEKLYNDNKRQVEIGTLAPIEVVRAEAEVARTRQELIVSQTNLFQQQTILKDLLTKNPTDTALALAEIEPLDQPQAPLVPEILPFQDALQVAMEKRPEIISAQLTVKNTDLEAKAARQALLPGVAVYGYYAGNGLAGLARVSGTVVESSGLPTAVTRAWQGDFPDYAFGININLPVRNRVAQADAARTEIAQRQSETRYQRVVNTIIVEVRNAQIALEQNRARIEAARKARTLAEQTFNAEQKKYQLGASTIFLVVQAQRDLAAARSVEVRAMVDLANAEVQFDRALGRTLDQRHITLEDARTGTITASGLPSRPPSN